jgi:8-oxo-dGTP diphosphatase
MQSGDKFCSGCAAPLELRQAAGRLRPVCPSCGRVVYYDPKIAATAIIQRQGRVLLIRRAGEVGHGLWSMPGGYVDRGEPAEAAAVREAWEETGLEVAVVQLVGLFSEAGHPVLVAAYAAREVGGDLQAGPEALEVGFFPLDQLPPLAFPRDALILARWRDMQGGA